MTGIRVVSRFGAILRGVDDDALIEAAAADSAAGVSAIGMGGWVGLMHEWRTARSGSLSSVSTSRSRGTHAI
jgi:hypothetical protein